ncbi:MAG: XdhC family protein [Woeseiaceae bacterium]|nr:XdhC family protein [Woeseiaceae bacterium]
MHTRKLLDFFATRRLRGQPLVLATVIATQGSTYSKAGERMLIDTDGIFRGMLSGGCLEGDLAIRARQVLESGIPRIADYDLSDDNDELWGIGVGCDGAMRIFLQPVSSATGYQPVVALLDAPRRDEIAVAVTVTGSGTPSVAVGATRVASPTTELFSDLPPALAGIADAGARTALRDGRSSLGTQTIDDAEVELFTTPIAPVPRLLVLGAGLDAEPLLRLAAEMGWHTTVCDHRPASIDNNDLSGADERLCVPADELARRVELDRFDAAVVMSHHLASDRRYLQALAASRVPYVGLLGPPGRRRRLLSELGDAADALASRLHGPAGLDLGGRGPAVIALSIVAEIQQSLAAGDLIRRRAGSSE